MAKARKTGGMKTFALLLLAGTLASGCMVSKEDYIKKAVRADELEDRNVTLQQKLDDQKIAEEGLRARIADLESLLNASDKKARSAQARITDLLARQDTISGEKSTLASELDGARKALKAAREEGEAAKESLSQARTEQTRRDQECAQRIAKLDAQLEQTRTRITNLETERDVLSEARQKSTSEKDEKLQEVSRSYEGLLAAIKQEAEQACQNELEGQHRDLVAHYEPRIEEIRGQALAYQAALERLTILVPFRARDETLFQGATATLKPEGRAMLNAVAKILETEPDRMIHVGVYGDRDPKAAVNDKTPGPWENTSARAAAIARHLVEKSGISPNRIIAAGYGDSNPVAPGETKEGRAKNRRVEIKLLLPEMIRE